MIAISLLVGNDHNLPGIPGIGLETAHRFAKSFREDEILDRFMLAFNLLYEKMCLHRGGGVEHCEFLFVFEHKLCSSWGGQYCLP